MPTPTKPTTNPVTSARAALASAVRLHKDPAPYRRRLAAEKVKREIRAALDAPDSINAEQRQELAALLVGDAK